MGNTLPCPIMGSFSPNSPVQNGFASSSEKNFNPEDNILCRPVTSSLLGKKTSDQKVKITLSLILLPQKADSSWADRFSILMQWLVHRMSQPSYPKLM